jgi:GGDEF domain-containing protein
VTSSAGEHRIGVSVGVALCRPDDTPDTVLSAADEAMYLVKASRRRR